MLMLMSAALAAAQPATSSANAGMGPMTGHAESAKKDCCDCCKDMAKGHSEHEATKGQ